MRLRRRRVGPAADRRVIWQAASLLLAYPDEGVRPATVDWSSAAVDTLPPAAREPLRQCVSRLAALDPMDAAVKYVDTFDWRRRRTPFLTYYTAGDTRDRGMALLEFANVYRAAGVVPPRGNCPITSRWCSSSRRPSTRTAGYRLLAAHRTPIDLLLDGLRKMESPTRRGAGGVRDAAAGDRAGPADGAAAGHAGAAGRGGRP